MSGPVDLRTLPFPMLVDEAWTTTRKWVRAVLLPIAMISIVPALALQLVSAWWNVQTLDPTLAGDTGLFCGTFLVGGLVLLVVMLGYLVIYGALSIATARAAAGRPTTAREAFRIYLRPSVFFVDIVAWLVTFVAFIFLVVPGLLVMAAWSLRLAVVAVEERRGFEILGRSWELLRYNPSRAFRRHGVVKALAVVVLGLAIGYAVSLLVQLPGAVVSQWAIFRDVTAGQAPDASGLYVSTLWITVPLAVLGSLAQLAVTTYIDFVLAHLYLDQRRRREGWDLEAELDRLEAIDGA